MRRPLAQSLPATLAKTPTTRATLAVWTSPGRTWSLGHLKPTKTYEERTVDPTPELAAALQRHFTWLKAEGLPRGRGEPEWLFPNKDGQPMDESRVRKVFKQAKLPEFRVYDLRHTYASLLPSAGAPITYVSAQLDHANPSTTLRYYAKWIPSSGRRWGDLLDRVAGFLGTRAARLVPKLEPIWNPNANRALPILWKRPI